MTPKEQAEALAIKAARVYWTETLRDEVFLQNTILTAIPLVELLECVEVLNKLHKECLVPDYAHDVFGSCPICRSVSNLDTKLKSL